MDEKTKSLNALDAARAKMRAVVEAIDPDREIYPGWTIKHVLAHLAGWDDAAINSIRAHIEGRPIEMLAKRGVDFYNQQTVTTREMLSFAQVRAEWEHTREQLKTLVMEVTPDKLQSALVLPWGEKDTPTGLAQGLAAHEQEHAEEIAELIAKD